MEVENSDALHAGGPDVLCVERALRDQMRAAYAKGEERGSKYLLVTLFLGVLVGWLAGFALAKIG